MTPGRSFWISAALALLGLLLILLQVGAEPKTEQELWVPPRVDEAAGQLPLRPKSMGPDRRAKRQPAESATQQSVDGKTGVHGQIIVTDWEALSAIKVQISRSNHSDDVFDLLFGPPVIHVQVPVDGRFHTALAPGTYVLSAYYPLEGGKYEQRTFEVQTKRWMALPPIELAVPLRFEGIVTGPVGKPVADAMVSIELNEPHLGLVGPFTMVNPSSWTTSDEKGEFHFLAWPDKSYILHVIPPYQMFKKRPFPLAKMQLAWTSFGEARRLSIRLEQGLEVELNLLLPKLPMKLRLRRADDKRTDVPWQTVESNGIWRPLEFIFVRQVLARGRCRLEAKLDLPWPQPVTTIELEIPRRSVLVVALPRGTAAVLDLESYGGGLPRSVHVKLWRRTEGFSLGKLPVIARSVTLPELPKGSYEFELRADGHAVTKSQRIRLDGRPGRKRFRFRFDAEVRLEGRILQSDGKPHTGLWLRLIERAPGWPGKRTRVLEAAMLDLKHYRARTDQVGNFSFKGLASGSYSLYLLGGNERSPIAEGPLQSGEQRRLDLKLDARRRTRHW